MSTPPGYNPYGRGTLKLTPDVFRAGNGSHARRWIQARARKLLSALSGGRSGGGVPSTETLRFVGMCAIWYTTSALSSNTGKVILNRFRYPVTLTIVQFAFVSVCSLLCMAPPFSLTRLRMPTRAILRTTLPMGMFQVGGHIFSSLAIARIPVSTVHTIKVGLPCLLSPVAKD
jgi:solute carrier family 35 protein E1